MVEFAGWEMPLQYTSLLAEHRAVRSAAGMFDISHMGELIVRGPDAASNLQRLLTNDVDALAPGQAHYTLICNERGGIIDDIILYRLEDRFMLVVNAANTDKDREWIRRHLAGRVTLDDATLETALIALQGPKAQAIVARLAPQVDWDAVRPFGFVETAVGGVSALASRTGYTGEDGFELYCAAQDAARLWEALAEAGKEYGLVPAGLGARDTLRLEARLPLYGNDLTEETSPYEAGLGFAVKLDKGDFIGRERLAREKEEGPQRRLVGFVMRERGGAPRRGYRVFYGGEPVGEVTSGSFSPTLEKDIGLAYVPAALAEPGTELEVEIRGRRKACTVHKGRFVAARAQKS